MFVQPAARRADFLLCRAFPADYAWRVEEVEEVVAFGNSAQAGPVLDFSELSGLAGKSAQVYTLVVHSRAGAIVVRATGALEFLQLAGGDVLSVPDLCSGGLFSGLMLNDGQASAWVVDPNRLMVEKATS